MRKLTTCAVAVGAALAGLTSCGSEPASSDVARDAITVPADYYASEYGVRVGVQVGFDDEREVTGARLVAGDQTAEVSLYPTDGSDPDRPPERVSLESGQEVLLEGSLLVPCAGGDPALPVFEVTSESGGAARTDEVAPSNPEEYRRAVAEWCDLPLTLHVTGSLEAPDGTNELHLQISNPGTEPVELTSEAVDDGTSTWEEERVVVPPASIERLTLHGRGPSVCVATPPWESGAVRADGEIVRPPAEDEWC